MPNLTLRLLRLLKRRLPPRSCELPQVLLPQLIQQMKRRLQQHPHPQRRKALKNKGANNAKPKRAPKQNQRLVPPPSEWPKSRSLQNAAASPKKTRNVIRNAANRNAWLPKHNDAQRWKPNKLPVAVTVAQGALTKAVARAVAKVVAVAVIRATVEINCMWPKANPVVAKVSRVAPCRQTSKPSMVLKSRQHRLCVISMCQRPLRWPSLPTRWRSKPLRSSRP